MFKLVFLFILNLLTTASALEMKLCYEDVVVFPWILGDDKGVVVSEMHLVEDFAGVKFNMTRLPWKRCQLEAEAGNYDGIISASYNSDRAKWGVYPYDKDADKVERDFRHHTDSFYLYVRQDSGIKFSNGKIVNLGDSAIGVQLGYSVGNDLQKQGYKIQSNFTDTKDVLKELDMGALKVAILQGNETTKVLNENPSLLKNIIRLETPFKVNDQYLLFTKKYFSQHEKEVRNIWKAMKKARESKAYVDLLEKTLGKK